MPTYDAPAREPIYFPGVAFGNSTTTTTYIGPGGKKGLVRDIVVHLTADCVGTTTVPEIDVGTASGDTTYARFRLGTAAGTGYTAASTPFRARPLTTGNPTPPVLADFAGHVALETAYLPKDTAFVVTLKAGTGGAPAGTGQVWVYIEWF